MEDIQPVELPTQETDGQIPEHEQALVTKLLATVKGDRAHHQKAFDQMRDDMRLATHGHDKNWPKAHYVANIIGRHVKQKTAALYAKNPKVVARRRETMDFALWDEMPESLMMAYQQVQMAQQPQIDPASGMVMPVQPPQEAIALLNDFMQGQERRDQMRKLGKTLEILYNHAMREQKPLDFKMGMKKLVRRTCTTGVGYVKLAFSREYGASPITASKIDDTRLRLSHLEMLTKDAAEGEIEDISAEMRELEISMAALQQEDLVLVNEGLIFDYPQSTRVIPDKNTMSLVGFVGARHLTVEYLFTVDEVREQFPDADLEEGGFTPFRSDWRSEGETADQREELRSTDSNGKVIERGKDGMIRVYEHFDKPSGMVYYLAEGHSRFLRAPAPPDVFVETFWPIFALTFNEVENEEELFPPSDARLMDSQQYEINQSRQGQREHRKAARPRYAGAKGILDDGDKANLGGAEPFTLTELNITGDQKISDILQVIPVPGVDPNLYETSPFFQDMQLVVGSQQATLGGISKATATESAISANSMAASDGSSVDDLDNFLTAVARAGGQILLREMSPERVTEIVGPGAFWPQMTLDQIADELFLEIEAGSTGKPNSAVEIDNWMKLLPMILQMPGANPLWVLRETLRRLDDKMDVTEAIIAGIPSIAMQNSAPQPNLVASEGGPANNPDAQGAEGAQNAPAGPPMQQRGSEPSFGSNQV